MRATLRWTLADLRRHRGEALFITLATLGIVSSLLLATALFAYATSPWQRVFTQTHGAHVWIHTSFSADARKLTALDGIESVAGPYPTESATVTAHGRRASVELRGTPQALPVSPPLLTAGRWLEESDPDGVVLESTLARALLAEPGNALALAGTDRTVVVVGIADSTEPRYSPGELAGTVWALPSVVRAPDSRVIGLRLTDPADTDYVIQRAVTALGAGTISKVSTWQQARAQAQGDSRLLGQVLALFGLGALAAAGFSVHGTISIRIRGHLRDISVLKAIGFTPGQVIRIFLFQHGTYAVLGAISGVALTQELGSRIPGQLGDAIRMSQGLPAHTTALFAVPVSVVVFIGATTTLAAWRTGRVPSVPVLRPIAPHNGRLSAIGRRTIGLGVPPALILGWHRAFARHIRSLAPIARLALPVLLMMVALSAWTTLDRFQTNEAAGLAPALTVRASGSYDEAAMRSLLKHDARIAAVYPGTDLAALVPGQTSTVVLRGMGSRKDPYPYTVAAGRPARGMDEAVAGQGLLDLLHIRIGDWVRVTVGGQPQILHIVGRSIEPDNRGRVISASLDTLMDNDPRLSASLYRLSLRAGATPGTVAADLSKAAGGQLDVYIMTNLSNGLMPLRAVVVALLVVLACVGLIELLTVIGGHLAEGQRDVLAFKAIGLTPHQVAAITVAATGFNAVLAVLVGIALGLPFARWLIDMQGRSSGIGAGIAQGPSTALLLLFSATAVLGSLACACLPALRALRHHPDDASSASVHSW
ncbi:FtsX-like permease family protein [Streptomyces sp. NPDC087901]|uniref:FtsX-like permease family protein n=1 Tax=Streptomyces sp. NPDC087901 TaxID=3365818 RepID=UPI0037FF478B